MTGSVNVSQVKNYFGLIIILSNKKIRKKIIKKNLLEPRVKFKRRIIEKEFVWGRIIKK